MKITSHLLLLAATAIVCISVVQCESSEDVRPRITGDNIGIRDASLKDAEGIFEGSDSLGSDEIADSSTNKGNDLSSGNVNGASKHSWDQMNDVDSVVQPPKETPGEEPYESPEPSPESEEEVTSRGVTDGSGEDEKIADIDMDQFSVDEVEERYEKEDIVDDEGVDLEYEEEGTDGSKMLTSTHKKGSRFGKVRKVRMFVASKTTVLVWRNFKVVGKTKTWKNGVELRFKARVGDSITLISKGWKRHFGVAAMVHDGRKRWFRTGGHGDRAFKAIAIGALKRMRKPDLRRPRQKMCYLRHPYAVKSQRGRGVRYARNGKAKMLYKYGAKYVWARGASWRAEIGVRFFVGGARCRRPRPSKKPSPSPKVGGGVRCGCRVVRTGTKGECFEFRNKRLSELSNKVAPCRRRVCGLKYECVQPGRRSRIVCVRRFARYEVRSIGSVFKGKCRNVPLRPAQPYYAPYS